jgi:hypothetical protein
MDEHRREDEEHNREAHAISESIYRITETEQQDQVQTSSKASDNSKRKRKMTVREKWNKTSLPNRLNIILTGIICFATVINVIVLWLQIADQDKQVGRVTTAINTGISKAKGAIEEVLSTESSKTEKMLSDNRAALKTALDAMHQDNQTALGLTRCAGVQ